MLPRFVTKTMHAFLDYPVAISLIVLPFALGLGGSHPLALWLAVSAGVAAFILTVFTDHKLGLVRIIPYKVHVTVDFLVGLVFLLAPFALGFSGIDAWYYWINAIAVITVVSLSEPGTFARPAAAAALGYLCGILIGHPQDHRRRSSSSRNSVAVPSITRDRMQRHIDPMRRPFAA